MTLRTTPIILTFVLAICNITAYAQEVSDTIQSHELNEVVVTADSQIETSKKTIFYPKKLESKHSTN